MQNTIIVLAFNFSIISLCLSIYNFIKELVWKRKNLDILIGFLTKPIGEFQYIQISFINKSREQISITDIQLIANEQTIPIVNSKDIYLHRNKKINGKTIPKAEYYTATTPFYICKLGYYTGCFKLDCKEYQLETNEAVEFLIDTNKGKIKKSLVMPNTYEIPKAISTAETLL